MQTTGHGYNNFVIKAFIISMPNNHTSTIATRTLIKSIEDTKSGVRPFIMPATEPHTINNDIKMSFSREYAKTLYDNMGNIRYTWPKNTVEDRLDLSTGLYLRAYAAVDWKKVAACTISHMRLWQHCIDLNEPILILEHDAKFMKNFSYKRVALNTHEDPDQPDHIIGTISGTNMKGEYREYPSRGEFTGGVCGINEPREGVTPKSVVYRRRCVEQLGANNKHGFKNDKGICTVPYINDPGDLPLPNGLAGNSAYIIKPWAAKKLLDKTAEIGIWPNDAVMCRQFFPWLQQYTDWITSVQQIRSTTTT